MSSAHRFQINLNPPEFDNAPQFGLGVKIASSAAFPPTYGLCQLRFFYPEAKCFRPETNADQRHEM
jgi:hypothetical protein